MINFTMGPVMINKEVSNIGAEQIPYFRTPEFSNIMFENEMLIKKFSFANNDSRAVFLTGSGTAAMEAAVINFFTEKDKVLIVNGGTFGERFVNLCKIHNITYTELVVENGKTLREDELRRYDKKGYTGFLVNMHETSTGVLYDMNIISEFCKNNGIFLVVDAISSFLADQIDMERLGIDALIIGSQKALACPPGISIVVISPKAIDKIYSSNVNSMYFNLREALINGERGQTPFTPAVGILIQINYRLKQIDSMGGVKAEINRISNLALDFREQIRRFPINIFSETSSNAMTSLCSHNVSAYDIVNTLKDNYNIWVCPNGGRLKDIIFRVGHIGDLTIEDNRKLIEAFDDMNCQGLL